MVEQTANDWIECTPELSDGERYELATLGLIARIQAFRTAVPSGFVEEAPALADLFEAADRVLLQLGWADEPPQSVLRAHPVED